VAGARPAAAGATRSAPRTATAAAMRAASAATATDEAGLPAQPRVRHTPGAPAAHPARAPRHGRWRAAARARTTRKRAGGPSTWRCGGVACSEPHSGCVRRNLDLATARVRGHSER
jgi:hypothetical protein